MNKSKYAFINCRGIVIAQNLESKDAGATLKELLLERAIIMPVTCSANNSSEAIEIYHEQIEENLDIIELSGKKESVHVY
mgnify:CR=1 FL=1